MLSSIGISKSADIAKRIATVNSLLEVYDPANRQIKLSFSILKTIRLAIMEYLDEKRIEKIIDIEEEYKSVYSAMFRVLKLRHSTDLWELIQNILTRVFKEKIPGQNKNFDNIITTPQTQRSDNKPTLRRNSLNADQKSIYSILTNDLGLVYDPILESKSLSIFQ